MAALFNKSLHYMGFITADNRGKPDLGAGFS
jgi:hypothetical protein